MRNIFCTLSEALSDQITVLLQRMSSGTKPIWACAFILLCFVHTKEGEVVLAPALDNVTHNRPEIHLASVRRVYSTQH